MFNNIIYTLLLVAFFFDHAKCQEQNETVSIYELAAELCNITGDPEYFNQFLDSLEKTSDCPTSVINITELKIEAEVLLPLGRMHELYNKTCRKQDALMNCYTSESAELDKCFSDSEIESKNVIFRVLRRGLQYTCGTDGETVTLFMKAGGPECFQNYTYDISICFRHLTATYRYINYISPSAFINPETCSVVKNFQKCMAPTLARCTDPNVANLFGGLLYAVTSELSCNAV